MKSVLKSIQPVQLKNKCKGFLSIRDDQINLDLTLLGGQSFRWKKFESVGNPTMWCGVAYSAYWELTQTQDSVEYNVHFVNEAVEPGKCRSDFFNNLLLKYFRADFDLDAYMQSWKAAHPHFSKTAQSISAVRVLDQEPLENIVSFICSQNNHIRRISTMIQWLCSKYGRKIGKFHGTDQFAFPTLDELYKNRNKLESQLRDAKFGYRAKFIARAIDTIVNSGGSQWLSKLRDLPYTEARLELVKLPGIGFKVADCICLMSLNNLESVPIDTHIFKIAQSAYLPQLGKIKSVTPKIYEEIGSHFRLIYGEYAGWAQAILFCSGLQQFQVDSAKDNNESQPKAKKKK